MKLHKEYKKIYIDDVKVIKGLDKKTIKAYNIDLTQFCKFVEE